MRASDRGSGTVLVVALIGVVTAVLLGALALVSAAAASTRARAAADLAALAAADRLVNGGGPPCSAARDVVHANEATLRSCRVIGQSVELRVGAPTGVPGLGEAHARSRAGPAAGVAPPDPSPTREPD